MPRYGTYEQREACDIFGAREEIIDKFNQTSVEDMRQNPDYYEEIMELLHFYLQKCKKLIHDEAHLQEILEDYPDFDNLAYDLCEYTYCGRTVICKWEIQEFIDILSVKMEEYKKYLMEITVNAGVALALLRIH